MTREQITQLNYKRLASYNTIYTDTTNNVSYIGNKDGTLSLYDTKHQKFAIKNNGKVLSNQGDTNVIHYVGNGVRSSGNELIIDLTANSEDTMAQKDLGTGVIGAAITTLYTVPTGYTTSIRLMTFSNNQSSPVYMTVYKQVAGNNYAISPVNMALNVSHFAQEDGIVALNSGDSIVAISSVDGGVDYTINGVENLIQ